MKLIHIIDGPPLYTNCFLAIGEGGKAVAVDPNADPQAFVAALEEHNATLTDIFLTHGHHDHISAVEPLRERYGARLWMNEADAKHFGLHPDETYTDGVPVEVDGMVFTPIVTPGHTPGSTCIRCGDVLFSGDTLFAGDIGRCDLPGGDFAEMQRSLKKLFAAVPDSPQVLPGHEEFSTMDAERAGNPFVTAALRT